MLCSLILIGRGVFIVKSLNVLVQGFVVAALLACSVHVVLADQAEDIASANMFRSAKARC